MQRNGQNFSSYIQKGLLKVYTVHSNAQPHASEHWKKFAQPFRSRKTMLTAQLNLNLKNKIWIKIQIYYFLNTLQNLPSKSLALTCIGETTTPMTKNGFVIKPLQRNPWRQLKLRTKSLKVHLLKSSRK